MKTKFFILALLGMMIATTTIMVSCSEDPVEGATLILSSTPLNPVIVATGGTVDITVTSNSDWTATSSAPEIATVIPDKGKNNGHVTVLVSANTTTEPRTVTITVEATGKSETVTINQVAAIIPTLTVTATIPDPVHAAGATYTVTVASNTTWTATSSNTATASVSAATGTKDGTFTVTVKENTTAETRSATITVAVTGKSQPITITQAVPLPKMQNFKPVGDEDASTTWLLEDARDQKVYTVVKMADGEIWMAQNLNFTDGLNFISADKYYGGADKVNQEAGSEKWPGDYACRDNHCDWYGAHYTHIAKKTVCPTGWSVPTVSQWESMFSAVRTALGGASDAQLIYALGKINDPEAEFPYWKFGDGFTNSTGLSIIGSGQLEPQYEYDSQLAILPAYEGDRVMRFGKLGAGDGDAHFLTDQSYPQLDPIRCIHKVNSED